MKINEQIYFWTHMLDEAMEDKASILLCEDIEGKNINRAEKFLKLNYSQFIGKEITLPNGDVRVMSARDWVTQVRNDVPSSRLPKSKNGKDTCKFLLGVTRIYFSFSKDNHDEIQGKISQLEKIMKILTSAHISEYDMDLNGLSFNDLNSKFSGVIQKNLDNEIERINRKEYQRDTSYTIVSIPDFKAASKYGKYTSWCITHQDNMYNNYTKDGLGLFYFCLKNGFETVKKTEGEGCPLDEYGKSMIAISVNDDGSLNTATCRWNHNNGGNDNIFKNAEEVSEFFGVNFFEVFKPRSTDELLVKFKAKAIPSKIANKLGGIETKDGLHIVKNGRMQTWKQVYSGPEGKCFAYDHLYWYDDDGNQISTPQKVGGSFSCSYCKSVTSLEGAPAKVGGDFDCSGCDSLTSLEGSPKEIGGDFNCSNCKSLTSLK